MKNKFRSLKQYELMQIGFSLLFSGLFLAMILDSNKVFQGIGIVLLIASSAVFGASMSSRKK